MGIVYVAAALVAACGGASSGPTPTGPSGRARVIETAELAIPIPEGYEDITANMQKQLPDVRAALSGKAGPDGSSPVIVLQKAAIPGGTTDAAACAERANTLVLGPPPLPNSKLKLRGTAVVDWAGGKACEIDFITPQGVPTILTELYEPENTPETPRDLWMMTCQHTDGDQRAIDECRSARAGLALRKPSGGPWSTTSGSSLRTDHAGPCSGLPPPGSSVINISGVLSRIAHSA